MIKAVIFDCFGVLYADASDYFLEHNVDNYAELYSRFRQILNAGDYGIASADEIYLEIADLTGLNVEFISKNLYAYKRRNEELIDYMSSLRQGYKIGMLSNISAGTMDQFFSKQERDDLFDAAVLSGEEHTVKPNPEIYHIISERLGVGPGECVLIDDRQENCWGADAAGMLSIHHQSNEQTIDELNDLIGNQGA